MPSDRHERDHRIESGCVEKHETVLDGSGYMHTLHYNSKSCFDRNDIEYSEVMKRRGSDQQR